MTMLPPLFPGTTNIPVKTARLKLSWGFPDCITAK